MHDFEILWQKVSIEIMDFKCEEAIFTNKVMLKATKDGAHIFNYILYGDGEIKKITTKEGSVMEIKKEGGRLMVKSSIESPINKGIERENTLTALYINSFSNENEYWQIDQNLPGSKFIFTLLTPLNRSIKNFQAYKILGNAKLLLDQQPKRLNSGNKTGINLELDKAKFLERYRIEWMW